jgi:homoserine kinase type II
LHLAGQNFPLPHLIGTRPDNNSMLVLNQRIYEMFEYVVGSSYGGSLGETTSAGKILGLFHKLLSEFHSDYAPPKASYHDASVIHEAIGNTITSLPLEGRPESDVLTRTINYLEQAYRLCAEQANKNTEALGLSSWGTQIVHGDWHPGNMLFRDNYVVAVIDYDTARLQQRVLDLANGAIQFSIIGGGEDPSAWPEYLDESRLKRFIRGYDSGNVITRDEIRVCPYLMCEAMIAEAVLPIAATGSFGRMAGFPFLQMIARKVKWATENAERLQAVLEE